VQVTSLSTTLATNAIVEGRGSRVGTVLYSPFGWFAEAAGLSPCVQIKGSLDISGNVLEDVDPEEALSAAEKLVEKEKCGAIAVGGYASIRNPALSARIKETIKERYPDLTVVCSHEISQKLNAVNSLKTAAANARIIPVIKNLIDSVQNAMKSYGIRGRLMIVKGDGTCVNIAAALEKPIETVLSGPASSVSGAKLLTGEKNAVVADVGGTTTDIAVVKDGLVDLSTNVAMLGGSVMQINAVSINTCGLGGDSRISFTRDRKIAVGPVRNIPVCFAASRYPHIAERLEEMAGKSYQTAADTSLLDVAIYSSAFERQNLTPDEERLRSILRERGAVFAHDARDILGLASVEMLHLGQLEASGAIKRAHLTPTDLFHIQGKMSKWDTESSQNAFGIFAKLLGVSGDELMKRIWQELRYILLSQVVKREFADETKKEAVISPDLEYVLRGIAEERSGVRFSLSLPHPLVAIGATVKDMFEGFGKFVNAPVLIPENADVANAVGAVSGEIIAMEKVYIRSGDEADYVVYSSEKRRVENTLSGATDTAVRLCAGLAREKAARSGAKDPSVRVTVRDRISHTADGGLLFVERIITGHGSGATLTADESEKG
ncbi:MAG: hydantoinase/oxoprolinase family protein, partial [Abditibacteriota bacterium]|nr:hydantoinase/oxoprolinase family protein [Abditibacteriota bacterium]